MWGWFTSIVDWLGTIAENIISLPIKIINGILDGIKAIFIPDTQELKNTFNTALDDISSIVGLPVDSVKDAFDSVTGLPVEDVEEDYNLYGVGTLKLKFFDTNFFRDGIDFFRPLLRGFIVLLLFFFNYKQLLSFLGQDVGIIARGSQSSESKGGGKE